MSYYEILLFLHVTMAIVWLGSGLFLQLLLMRAESTDDRLLTKQLSGQSEWMAHRIFIPASLAVLILGILLTIEGPWSFEQLWIVLGLVGYAVSFLVGILILKPEGERIHAAMTEQGSESPEAAFHIRRIHVVSRMELVILYLVVAVMVLKPTADDTGMLIAGSAIVLAALALGFSKLRGLQSERPAVA